MKPRTRGVVVALAVAVGCGPSTQRVPEPVTLTAPRNACPPYSCSAYAYAGVAPNCDGNQCLVTATIPGLVYVVSMSDDAGYAPGQTYLLSGEPSVLFANSTSKCEEPCAHVPSLGYLQEEYTVDPATQLSLGYDLDHPGELTALPVHATFEPYWNGVDAALLGLPVTPVDAYVVDDTSVSQLPGPGDGPSIALQANLQPGMYLQTISPDPPYGTVFPPDVGTVTVAANLQRSQDPMQLDTTEDTSNGAPALVVPTFNLSPLKELVGRTAYLRDATTRQCISSQATVGKNTTTVMLATNQHRPKGDALVNAQFVLAPPEGEPIPTYIQSPQANELSTAVSVPTLPPPVTVSGIVTAADGTTPVEAELVFESIAGASPTEGIYVSTPQPGLNPSNFEYTAYVSASPATSGGLATYSVDLPPGSYQLTVVPRDAAYAVTVDTVFDVEPGTTPITALVSAGTPLEASGIALLADGRPLAGATVEAVPTGCYAGAGTACLPRAATTTTDGGGNYALSLDPGNYTLRIEPAQGSGFPWVVQSLFMATTNGIVPAVTIPAPIGASLTLHDPADNPVINAVVRAYVLPASGQAVEIGRSITDASGAFSMFLTPPSQ